MIIVSANTRVYTTNELAQMGFVLAPFDLQRTNYSSMIIHNDYQGVLLHGESLEDVLKIVEMGLTKTTKVQLNLGDIVGKTVEAKREVGRIIRHGDDDRMYYRFDESIVATNSNNPIETDLVYVQYSVNSIACSFTETPTFFTRVVYTWCRRSTATTYHIETGNYHSYNDQPARVVYSRSIYNDFVAIEKAGEQYYQNGVMHRDAKPAVVYYDGSDWRYYHEGTEVTNKVQGAIIDDKGTIDSLVWDMLG